MSPHVLAIVAAIGVVALAAFTVSSGDDAQRPTSARPADDRRVEAERMVTEQLRGRDIRSAQVLAAMAKVPRHRFVPPEGQREAYADHPLPIGHGQTISQPYVVAFMTEALELSSSDRVLEIGTGSGYLAAVLAELAGEVYTIELVPELAARARATLDALGYRRVRSKTGDGYLGWREHAPFTRIIVTAAPEVIPPALVEQLAEGGVMAVPVGPQYGHQELRILRKTPTGLVTERSLPVRFVPMVKPKG